jgi:hypothetical protein
MAVYLAPPFQKAADKDFIYETPVLCRIKARIRRSILVLHDRAEFSRGKLPFGLSRYYKGRTRQAMRVPETCVWYAQRISDNGLS